MSANDPAQSNDVRMEAAIGAFVIGVELFAVYLVFVIGLLGLLGFSETGLGGAAAIAGAGALISAWKLYGLFRANLVAARQTLDG